MGSAYPKDRDPARVHYKDYNIYLNSIKTYARIPPTLPITIHQKALFTFWMSTFMLWLILKFVRIIKSIAKPPCENETDIEQLLNEQENGAQNDGCRANLEKENENQAQVHPSVKQLSPGKKCWTTAELYASPAKESESPSKRKDYLDEGAFTASPNRVRKIINDEKTKLSEKIKDEARRVSQNVYEKLSEDDTPVKKPYMEVMKTYVKETVFSYDKDQPSFEQFLSRMMIFGCFMFYFWLTDYLHLWPKMDKQYSRDIFIFLFFILVFVAFVFTITKTKDKLLNRDQTEEWKGWMQVQFVWYHYFDAQETFNSIRCYVGAYVWMTGFGNFIYFYTRKDYTIFRLLKMLFRLNFLVLSVMAVSNNNFVRYYICAMHTYWFLSVWAVMVAFNKYNDNPKFIYLKFFIYAVINACIFNIPGASEKVFTPLKFILRDNDKSLRYWKYRAWLDHWSTLVGMIVAFNYPKIEKLLTYLDQTSEPSDKKKKEFIRYAITGVLLAFFGFWFCYILQLQKPDYLNAHPFTSPIPIVIYTWLRNLHPILRTHYLNLFTWLGKITLETYLSQIHIYMIGDAKAILVYLPRYPMLNFTISTLIYIGVSYVLFKLTVFFSSYIFPRNGKVVIKNIVMGAVWLTVCYVFAMMLTEEKVWPSKKSGLEFLLWNVTKYQKR